MPDIRQGQRNDQSDITTAAQPELSDRTRRERLIPDQGQDRKQINEEGPQRVTELGRDRAVAGGTLRDLKLAQCHKE